MTGLLWAVLLSVAWAGEAPDEAAAEKVDQSRRVCEAWSRIAPERHDGCVVFGKGQGSFAVFGHDRVMLQSYPDFDVDAEGLR